jgi:hypothetical protein
MNNKLLSLRSRLAVICEAIAGLSEERSCWPMHRIVIEDAPTGHNRAAEFRGVDAFGQRTELNADLLHPTHERDQVR